MPEEHGLRHINIAFQIHMFYPFYAVQLTHEYFTYFHFKALDKAELKATLI